MLDLIQRALHAKRESKYIEFKQTFDPASPREWCEIVKDVVALANSGGGIIVFGLDSHGQPTGARLDAVASIDPADIANRISKYIGPVTLEFEIRELRKHGYALHALLIQSVSVPIVFQKPGTFDIGSGQQRTAFGVGTVYFRHGAKSEPGSTEDIRSVFERQLEVTRKDWLKGVRKVGLAPPRSHLTMLPFGRPTVSSAVGRIVRVVNDPRATPVALTRDPKKAAGSFVHEEISEGIFDEINNVIDANRVLARGQKHFFLGLPIYYRIYAERHHVEQKADHFVPLFHSAVADLYAPALFWALGLSEKTVAQTFAELYVHPKNPSIHCLTRMAILLGPMFSDWLFTRWQRKWSRHPQPPGFYFAFQEMRSRVGNDDLRIIAARITGSARFEVEGDGSVTAAELIHDPRLASSLLSKACMRVFEGESDMRHSARNLDYLAYGHQLSERASVIAKAIIKAVGDQEAGELTGTTKED
jgi:hypothetical protein